MRSGWTLTLIMLVAAAVLLLLFILVTARKGDKSAAVLNGLLDKTKNKRRFNLFLQLSYVRLIKVPVIKRYIKNIRKRLEVIHSQDEYTIRRETMRITYAVIGITLAAVIALLLLNGGLIAFLWIVLVATVANGILVDTFVNKVEDKLLKQSVVFYEDVRHHYQQTKNVEEAIYEATLTSPHEAGRHGERVYEVLTSDDQVEALEKYYEVAPNRYYRLFAGISYLVSEYGDRNVKNGSMYLNAIARLVQEINYEILRRDKLNYLLKGLAAVAVAPVLAMAPVEQWAKTYFPVMNDFYDSKAGLVIKVAFFAVVLICYLLIRKMLENDEARYTGGSRRLNWEKFLYERTPFGWAVDRLKPKPHQRLHFQLTMLIKQANSPLTLEWLYVQRLAAALTCFIVAIGLFVYMHASTVSNTLYNPLQNMAMFGELSDEEIAAAEQTAQFDRDILEQLETEENVDKTEVIRVVSEETDSDTNNLTVIQSAQRIWDKYHILKTEYFKWWELVVGILLSFFAYQTPVWLLQFQKRMRQMEMQNEVDQFHSIIAILAEFERMSVEMIMEWMERFAIFFRDPLKLGMNEFSSGALHALEQLKQDAPFTPFVRIVEKLQLSVEKIPLKDAFDDLEMAREYYQEKRKEHNSRVIEQKAAYGKIIGFIPLGYIIFLNLVLPMLYLSVREMGNSMSQISGL